MASANLNELLEKTADWDKDERYMATSDLCAELQKDMKIDASMERRICAAILKRLDDASNDVQSIAVKCLGILVKKVQEAQVGEICDKLCSLILEGNEALRDIYCIGLRTLINDVPEHMGRSVATQLAPRLLSGVTQNEIADVKLECLDIVSDLLKRFGAEVEAEHSTLTDVVLHQLSHAKPAIVKRAIVCLSSLAVVLSDVLLNRLVDTLLGHISNPADGQDVRSLIQTIGSISRTVGFRLGRDLDRIVPLFLQFCGDPESEAQQTELSDELRENCLQGFESFVLRCPREVTPHLPEMLRICQQFMVYDPNYTYEDDEEEDDEEEEDEYSDDDMDEFSDDDDSSWKVRRAALHVLSAIVSTRPELLKELYTSPGEEPSLADQLIARFKEREENVRLDVLGCFTEQLKATTTTDTRGSHNTGGADPCARQISGAADLESKLPAIVAAANKQMGAKGTVKTKSAVFAMYRQLAIVLPGKLADHCSTMMSSIVTSLQDKATGIKLDALVFLRLLLQTHEPEVAHPFVAEILPHVVACVSEDWYKIIAEALRVVGVLSRVVRPRSAEGDMFVGDFDHSPHVMELYNAVLPRLQAHDIDQEIKESAIIAMGAVISAFGDCDIGDEVKEVLSLMMQRLRNEITRPPTLRAFAEISKSPANVDLTSVLDAAVGELAQFMRQQSRSLKQMTLETLDALVTHNGQHMSAEQCTTLMAETANLVSDSDLHLSYLSLSLTVSVLGVCADVADTVRDQILPRALALARSPLLQGMALTALKHFFRVLVTLGSDGLSFDALFTTLAMPADGSGALPKPAVANIARCVSVLCINTDVEACRATVRKFIQDVQSDASDTSRHLALMSLGEIGRERDLSSEPGLQDVILAAFDDARGTEETKSAAAFALGNVAVGNMSTFLPVLLRALDEGGRNEYLLLSALKEVIACHSTSEGPDFAPYVAGVLPPLTRHCLHAEEGVRNMVADCLGRLAIIVPEQIVPKLTELCGDGSSSSSDGVLSRWTAITAIKTCVTSARPLVVLEPAFGGFMTALEDEDLSVRRAALHMLNSTAHHQPQLLGGILESTVYPVLFKTMELKMARTVDLGPFKHKVDDALPLRKAAFSIMDTLLDTMPSRVNLPLFINPYLCTGLKDHDDIQVLSHQILIKACALQPAAVLSALDTLVEPLDKSVNRKLPKSQVASEVDRVNDQVRSTLRAVVAISKIYDRQRSDRKFQDFLDRITSRERFATMLQAIQIDQHD